MRDRADRNAPEPQATALARVWDLPVRLVHWALVALFALAWWTQEQGAMDWHRRCGYALLTLLLFRVYWGFVGSGAARFGSFLRSPRVVASYARRLFERPGPRSPGHNPMGGWSVLALLSLLLLQAGSGLFSVDTDGLESGPLAAWIDFDLGRRAAALHGFNFNLLLGLIALHVLMVAFYALYKRDRLIAAMVGGYQRVPADAPAWRFEPGWKALLGLAVAAAIVAVIAMQG